MTSISERFWSKVNKRGPDDCWEWKSAKNKQGYGRFSVDGKTYYAHRIAWELTNSPIPEHDSFHGICCLHKCDNPPCVNPDHLFIGTHQDNTDDREAKGRGLHRFGENHANAKLTYENVAKIHSLKGQLLQREIAVMFGVTHSVISKIHRNEIWLSFISGS